MTSWNAPLVFFSAKIYLFTATLNCFTRCSAQVCVYYFIMNWFTRFFFSTFILLCHLEYLPCHLDFFLLHYVFIMPCWTDSLPHSAPLRLYYAMLNYSLAVFASTLLCYAILNCFTKFNFAMLKFFTRFDCFTLNLLGYLFFVH